MLKRVPSKSKITAQDRTAVHSAGLRGDTADWIITEKEEGIAIIRMMQMEGMRFYLA